MDAFRGDDSQTLERERSEPPHPREAAGTEPSAPRQTQRTVSWGFTGRPFNKHLPLGVHNGAETKLCQHGRTPPPAAHPRTRAQKQRPPERTHDTHTGLRPAGRLWCASRQPGVSTPRCTVSWSSRGNRTILLLLLLFNYYLERRKEMGSKFRAAKQATTKRMWARSGNTPLVHGSPEPSLPELRLEPRRAGLPLPKLHRQRRVESGEQ